MPRIGQGHCPNCGRLVAAQTREQIVARILEELPAGTSFLILAPVVRGQKGEYKDLFTDLGRERAMYEPELTGSLSISLTNCHSTARSSIRLKR